MNKLYQHYKDSLVKEIRISGPSGQAYQDEVPDTFDISEVAELTIRAITNRIDPDKGYLMYTRDNFYADPPHMHFLWANEGACEGKHLEGLPLLRMISGSNYNEDREQGFWESILRLTGDDGCFYLVPELYKNPGTPSAMHEPHTSVEREGRHILALCMRYQLDENPATKELIEKKINRLIEIATYQDDYAYFTFPYCPTGEVSFTPGDMTEMIENASSDVGKEAAVNFEERFADAPALLKIFTGGQGMFESLTSAHMVNFMLARSLCVYYRISGYKPAIELAGKIVKGVITQRKGFKDDGCWIINHFHTATATLLSILEYAMIKQDQELITLVNKAYQFGKASGEAITGFFSEFRPGSDNYLERRLCETCGVADMICLSIKLTLAGAGDYWSDTERWARNQFVENQLTTEKLAMMLGNLKKGKQPVAPQKIEWMKALIDSVTRQKAQDVVTEIQIDSGTRIPIDPPMNKNTDKNNNTLPEWISLDIEQTVGCFSGWAFPNDWGAMSMHGCCTGNASRTIYWIWDSIVTIEENIVKVNLLMNRASKWLDIDSYLPYEGRVVLKIKEADEVAVRIPEWTDRENVNCTVGSRKYNYTWSGNYIFLDGLRAGDIVDIRFPMKTETLFKVIAGDIIYKLTIKGYTVIDIEPKGEICPLYCRDFYKSDVAPVKKVTRFIPDRKIRW